MSVFEKNGRWNFRFQIKGREYWRAVPEATSKKEALKAEAALKGDLLHGKYDLAENIGEMAFTKLAEKYLDYAKSNKLSWKSDVSKVNHLLDFFGNKKLREINSFDVERYKSKRQKEKTCRKKIENNEKVNKLVSSTTINREIEVLRKMFNIAIDNDWINSNPCNKVKKLRQDNKIERFLQPQEEENLFKNCVEKYAYLKPIIIMALHSGMRKGEILNLKWENVDLKRKLITLTKTKNGKVRKIPISQTLLNILNELSKNKSSNFVFTNPKTGKNYVDIKKSFTSLCTKAKISDLRFHDLRHSAATRMVACGVDLVVVQEILGHEDLKTTQRYSHPLPENKVKAIEALDKFGIMNNNVISIVN